jgi:uncharacterized protein
MIQVVDLFVAIRNGELPRVAAILDGDPTLARARQEGASALLFARYCGRHDVVGLLRRHLPVLDVFETCALGDTERLAAILDGDPGLVNAVAEDGFGPLGLASFFDHEPAVRLLLARGARVDQASANGMRVMPLHSAAAARSVTVARLLLAFGADPTLRDGEGRCAADYARAQGHDEAVARLG